MSALWLWVSLLDNVWHSNLQVQGRTARRHWSCAEVCVCVCVCVCHMTI